MKLRTEEEMKKALKDTEAYLKEICPEWPEFKPCFRCDECIQNAFAIWAIATEACTLRWSLGKGVLNCYIKEEDKDAPKD